jgi:hypothetical protein
MSLPGPRTPPPANLSGKIQALGAKVSEGWNGDGLRVRGVLRNARNARLSGRWRNGKDAPGPTVPERMFERVSRPGAQHSSRAIESRVSDVNRPFRSRRCPGEPEVVQHQSPTENALGFQFAFIRTNMRSKSAETFVLAQKESAVRVKLPASWRRRRDRRRRRRTRRALPIG